MKIEYVSIPKNKDYVNALQLSMEGEELLIEKGVPFRIRKRIAKGEYQELSPEGWVDNYLLTIKEVGRSETNPSILYIPLSTELNSWIDKGSLEIVIEDKRLHLRPNENLYRIYENILWSTDEARGKKSTNGLAKYALPLLVAVPIIGGAYWWFKQDSPQCEATDFTLAHNAVKQVLEPNKETVIPLTTFISNQNNDLSFSSCQSSTPNIVTTIGTNQLHITATDTLQQQEQVSCEIKNVCGQTQLATLLLSSANNPQSEALSKESDSAEAQHTLTVEPDEFTLKDHDISMPIDILANDSGDDLTIKKCTKIYTHFDGDKLIFNRPKIMPENTYKRVNFDCQIEDRYGEIQVNHVDVNVEILALDLNIPKSPSAHDEQFDLGSWISEQTGWAFKEEEFSCRKPTLPLGTTIENGWLHYHGSFDPNTMLCMIQFSSYRPTLIKVNISNN